MCVFLLARTTLDSGQSAESGFTRANRLVQYDVAHGVGSARVAIGARVDAIGSNAGFLFRTIRVVGASDDNRGLRGRVNGRSASDRSRGLSHDRWTRCRWIGRRRPRSRSLSDDRNRRRRADGSLSVNGLKRRLSHSLRRETGRALGENGAGCGVRRPRSGCFGHNGEGRPWRPSGHLRLVGWSVGW
jgi:hypothetical protein